MNSVKEVKLSTCDKLILDSYKKVLDGLAEYMGKGYEIVLHSLENFDHSVIKIINGEYTGRKEGAPITDLALRMLQEIQEKGQLGYICYSTENAKGEPLKSATIVIPGEKNNPIGVLCINFYLNTSLSEFITSFMSKELVQENFSQEHLKENPTEMVKNEIKKAIAKVDSSSSIMPSLRNREIIAILEENGVFQIKESIHIVAQELDISKNTVYLHLRTIRKNME